MLTWSSLAIASVNVLRLERAPEISRLFLGLSASVRALRRLADAVSIYTCSAPITNPNSPPSGLTTLVNVSVESKPVNADKMSPCRAEVMVQCVPASYDGVIAKEHGATRSGARSKRMVT